MLNKILVATAATVIAAGTAMAMPVPADAAMVDGMSCGDAAKMQYPNDRKMRHAWKKECKEHYKMSVGKTGLLGKFKLRGNG